jgi:hypothetical protein
VLLLGPQVRAIARLVRPECPTDEAAAVIARRILDYERNEAVQRGYWVEWVEDQCKNLGDERAQDRSKDSADSADSAKASRHRKDYREHGDCEGEGEGEDPDGQAGPDHEDPEDSEDQGGQEEQDDREDREDVDKVPLAEISPDLLRRHPLAQVRAAYLAFEALEATLAELAAEGRQPPAEAPEMARFQRQMLELMQARAKAYQDRVPPERLRALRYLRRASNQLAKAVKAVGVRPALPDPV